jgi:hypothetical protein
LVDSSLQEVHGRSQAHSLEEPPSYAQAILIHLLYALGAWFSTRLADRLHSWPTHESLPGWSACGAILTIHPWLP